MNIPIEVISPTDLLRRTAFVTMPLADLAGDRAQSVNSVSVSGGKHRVLAQIDRIDPDLPSRDVVSMLIDDVPGGGVKFGVPSANLVVSLEQGGAAPADPDLGVYEEPARVEMWSNRFRLHIHLPKEPTEYQGGAITSIQLDDREMLDPIKAEIGPHDHDPEKRLQVDRVRIANPPWSDEPWTEHLIFTEAWKCVKSGSGPVRAFANLESSPFTVDHGGVVYTCHLHRVVSIFHNVDYILDELYVTGRKDGATTGVPDQLSFAAHYFLKMNCGVFPPITRVPLIPDWFSIGATEIPFPGYGFAATVPCGRIDNPPIDYPNERSEHSAFSWDLGFAREARCVHLFKRRMPANVVADETGRAWFDLLFKSTRAKIQEAVK